MIGPPVLVRSNLRALGSDIELASGAALADRRLGRAARWLAAFESRFSRFRPLSELSRLNAAAGRPFRASPGLLRLVGLALELAQRSGGLFDPTVLPHLLAAGYDRSFEDLLPTSRFGPSPPRFSWRDVVLDAAAGTVLLPSGAGIDLGGIGKGFAADQLASVLGTPSLVNAGGDVRLRGRPPGEEAWLVGVADPLHPERDLAVLRATDRAIATSSSLRRRWHQAGVVQHHLIDPRTGRPSHSDAVQVTVVADSALLADYHAKVALLRGAASGRRYLEAEDGVEGIIVRAGGGILVTAGIGRYCVEPLQPRLDGPVRAP
jgi:thiamine biosynthesis lipoprotein